MALGFYSSPEYRKRQSIITRKNWEKGKYDSLIRPLEIRYCKNPECGKSFSVKKRDHKMFCSHKCSAHIGNRGRILSPATRLKMSKSISSLSRSMLRIAHTKPKIILSCAACKKDFAVTPYLGKKRKYCSVLCAIRTIGRKTTSPRASKGKSGVRIDIDPNICFYSTWEANIARVFNLVNLRWVYAPEVFDLGKHTYRPDFYLPDFDMFIEVKNFLGDYSLKRHLLFKKKYPNVKLELLMKDDYVQIKSDYKYFIENWEY